MQKKYLPLALVLVVLLTLLALVGMRTMEAAPTIGFAAESKQDSAVKQVYLTFDDGPSTVVTGRILDILGEEQVKATFFIVSDRVYRREETLKRIASEGHTLGVHSATHIYHEIYASDEAFLKDVKTCASVIEKTTGITPRVYRFPGGGPKNKEHHTEILKRLGYRVVGWNAVCGDEEIPHASAEQLLQETIKTSQGKEKVILLLHDSATHKETARALPGIISYFRDRGFTFCQF